MLPAPIQTSYTWSELAFLQVSQAAWWYSLINPLSTRRRLTRPSIGTTIRLLLDGPPSYPTSLTPWWAASQLARLLVVEANFGHKIRLWQVEWIELRTEKPAVTIPA
ncbi:hypothetical protein [Nonomuraea dietziae]|uniref:hypothetical protein n=1 Tax=Nonomuraea dietziae TaxID=65515 RepID=UPI00343B2D88